MKPLLILALLASVLVAYTPTAWSVNQMVKPTIPLGLNISHWPAYWQQMSGADRVQAVTAGVAWLGTITTFAAAPFYERHAWARTVVTIAGTSAVLGLFATYAAEAIPEREAR